MRMYNDNYYHNKIIIVLNNNLIYHYYFLLIFSRNRRQMPAQLGHCATARILHKPHPWRRGPRCATKKRPRVSRGVVGKRQGHSAATRLALQRLQGLLRHFPKVPLCGLQRAVVAAEEPAVQQRDTENGRRLGAGSVTRGFLFFYPPKNKFLGSPGEITKLIDMYFNVCCEYSIIRR